MAQGTVRLLFSLVGQDKLSSAITTSQKSLDSFADSAEKSGGRAGKVFGKLSGIIGLEMPGKITDLKSGFDLLGGAVDQIAAAINEVADGEKRLNAQRIFEQASGGARASAEAMDEFGDAVGNAIDSQQIVDFANQMRFAGLETKTISDTLRTAFVVAQATNQDMLSVADRLKESLVTGSQGGFEMIGITKNLNAEIEKQAKAIGTNVDAMSTSEKAQLRLQVVNAEMEKKFVSMNIDVKELSTTFQSFKSSVDDATGAAAEFAAQQFGETQREKEADALKKTVIELGKTYKDAIGKAQLDQFSKDLSDVTGLAETQVQNLVLAFRKANKGIVSDRSLSKLAQNLQKEVEEQDKARLEQLRKANRAEADEDRRARTDKATRIEFFNDQFRLANEQLAEAIAGGTEAEQALLQGRLEEIKFEMGLLGAELKPLSAEVKRSLFDAKKFKKEATDLIKSAADEEKKQKARDKERATASKARADRLEQLRQRNLRAETETANIQDRRRVEELKKQKKFDQAKLIEIEIAERSQRLTRKQQKKLTDAEELLRETQLQESIRKIREDFATLEKEDAKKQREQDLADKEKQAQDAEDHANRIAEIRRLRHEEDLRIAEEFASRAQSLSGDLRRYDDDTATIIQGQAEVTQAIAQNSGNAAKQASAAIAAGGRTTEALIKNDKAAAATRAAFETAAGFASIAAADPVGATMHFTAAGLFAALAGKSAGKKGGARQASQTISRGGGGGNIGFGGSQTGSNVTVNVAGFVSGSSKDLGVELGNTIQGVQDTGLSTETV